MEASPSKARAHVMESHSWSIVLSWLSSLYHPLPLPAFERKSTTLKALQALKAENIAADRLQQLLFEAQREELAIAETSEMQRRDRSSRADTLLAQLEDALSESAKASLKSLTSSAVLLGCCPVSSRSHASNSILQDLPPRILQLSRQSFTLEDRLTATKTLTSNLKTQTTQSLKSLSIFQQRTSPSDNPNSSRPSTPPHPSTSPADPAHLHAQTLQHQRETKQLQLKSVEYQARIVNLENQLASSTTATSHAISIAAFVSKQQDLEEKTRRVEQLEAQFRAFDGLPPDIEASRRELQRAQGELDVLKRRRDELFERL